MLCLKRKWEEEKVQQQSNERGAMMVYAISIFSKQWYGSRAEMMTLNLEQGSGNIGKNSDIISAMY